ncbi:MAG TPA: hypothetical protein VHX61_09545 [Rhizomicrobium sp.]|jgi:hypothetical protein|nr:hypothetical protein [Rhizomicrobium sp.]
MTNMRIMAKSGTANGRSFHLKSSATAARFRAAAKRYTKKATKSRAAAVKTLQREGILTPKGRLSKHYAPKV